MTLDLLVVSSETPDQQAKRRARSGQASHETLAGTLRRIDPDIRISDASCVTGGDGAAADLARHDGILLAGSPIQMHEATAETRAAAAFMARVFASGTPSFGTCAGLQIAAVGAGGTVKARAAGIEAGIARAITSLVPDHPLLAGRDLTWDALAMHSSEIDRRPAGMTVLARTRATAVEAAEIRCGAGVHWGVQYHPELNCTEIAAALRASADELVAQGMVRDGAEAACVADRFEALGAPGGRPDLAWQMGVQPEIASEPFRTREIANFLAHLRARP